MKFFIIGFIILAWFASGHAEETLTEKTQATTNTVKLSAKKGYHRTKEAVCGTLTGDSKVQCLAKQTKNRIEETKDSVTDKASEVKNNLDKDKTN